MLAVVAGIANLAPVAKLANVDITFLQSWLEGGVDGATYVAYSETVFDGGNSVYDTTFIGTEETTVLIAARRAVGDLQRPCAEDACFLVAVVVLLLHRCRY